MILLLKSSDWPIENYKWLTTKLHAKKWLLIYKQDNWLIWLE